MSDETERLWRYHLWHYYEGLPEQRSEAFGFLMAQGAAIVPWLMGELVKKCEGDLDTGRPSHDTLHLAALLTELGDPRSLRLIYGVGDSALLKQLLETLEGRASPDDIQALVAVLKAFGNKGVRSLFFMGFEGEVAAHEAIAVAQLLVRMAERDPKPELREALPLLRGGMFFPSAPLEFIGLRKRLKAALGDDNLPIPATGTPDRESLPIPSHEDKRR